MNMYTAIIAINPITARQCLRIVIFSNFIQWDLKKNGRSAESPFGRVVGSPQLT